MHRLVSFCQKLASSYKITIRPRPGILITLSQKKLVSKNVYLNNQYYQLWIKKTFLLIIFFLYFLEKFLYFLEANCIS